MWSPNTIRPGRRVLAPLTLTPLNGLRWAKKSVLALASTLQKNPPYETRIRIPSSHGCRPSGYFSAPARLSLQNPPQAPFSTTSQLPRWSETAVSKFWAAVILISASVLLPFGTSCLLAGCFSLIEASYDYADKRQAALEEHQAIRRLWQDGSPTEVVYSPLGEDEFRVLVLEPGARDDEITCRLCICNHSDRVPYAALSYTWGNPKKVERIRCNGHELGVASNLYGALLQLRDPDRERMLWIDALCINQDDFNERGHQVRNMKTIYSEAREVLVWLGPEDEAVSRVFKSLTSFKPNFYYLLAKTFTRSSLFSGSSSDWQTIGFDFAIAEGHNHLLAADLVSLTKVLERPWFRRLWVLQEVAHAKRVTIVSGKWTIEWELLARLVRYLNHSGLLLDHLSKTAHVGVLAVVEMETARRGTVARKQRSLLSVLLATHSGECSDVRDKIYAVLNLADDYNLDRDIQSFGPDYHLSARDVFTKFARWSIARGNLDILSCTTRSDTPGTEELEGLPSWVPDWTRIDNETPFVRYMNKISFKSGASLQRLAPDEPRVTEDDKLILSGVAVDVVKGVGPRSTFNKSGILEGYSAPVLAANKRWLDSCLRLGYSAHQGMFSNYSCKRSFWRTMTAGLTGQGVQAPPHFGSWFHKYLHLLGWIHQPAMDSSYLRVPDLVITDDDRKRRTQSAAIESAILMWASKRRFAVTEGGRMALVPNTTREGDRIVIVAGSGVPQILRPVSAESSEHYMILGEAFVDEFMDGGFLESLFEKQKHRRRKQRELLEYFTVV